MRTTVAREILMLPYEKAQQYFKDELNKSLQYDSCFISVGMENVIVVGGFESLVPAIREFYKDEVLANYLDSLETSASHLFNLNWDQKRVSYYIYKKNEVLEKELDATLADRMYNICQGYKEWAGVINENGEHVINLKNPVPGPHFYTNMLLGDRMNTNIALQSTPKSVIDRLGGGSFRSHAATQVLATRWDMLPEENGFPANRQFYIVEDGKQIFYSADVLDGNVEKAYCIHSQNNTRIEYETKCGLKIKRTIFLLPQYDNLPVATEVQRIEIVNTSNKKRNLKIVTTGMFGAALPHALMEDVVYSTVIMQSKVLADEEGNMLAYIPSYYPEEAKTNVRFTSLVGYTKEKKHYAHELCTQYTEFVGSGNLQRPQGVAKLSNRLSTKGPGFFALGLNLSLDVNETSYADTFTGLVSTFETTAVPEQLVSEQIKNLHSQFDKAEAVNKSLDQNSDNYAKYCSYLQIQTGDKKFDTYVNKNLPFQVLYQTFVSRSFDLTQKGYREIGFREIQDIFVSLYYLVSMGKNDFTKSLLKEWISKVFDFGYVYHNFFWQGKEAGKWSDDGLWLLQAVYRYISYTGEIDFLDACYPVAGEEDKTRCVYETLKSIINYSSEISIGEHGMPLIDFADWNDCLQIDNDYISGPEKERLYKQGASEKEISNGDSESVMNAFLLKLAIDHMINFAEAKNDAAYVDYLNKLAEKLTASIQKHAWKEDFFARVLFNRYGDEITYLGAKGDGFSADSNIDGTYFLNSFSWSILSGVATEEQIGIMLDQIEKYLKTPFGLILMSPTDLSKVAKKTATGHYFPGDRENAGVFKHATMMGTAAMLQAAKSVKDKALAKRLSDLAFWMLDLVLPYRTLEKPFEICGNPRWCTQYNNSQTGENIGPTLSGTSTWMLITLIDMLGIDYKEHKLVLNPILKEEDEYITYTVRFFSSYYKVTITKPKGIYRVIDDAYVLTLDNMQVSGNEIKLVDDHMTHEVILNFTK